ncbi:MAG: topoisomerase DNA-binding C4 zinc finger domain-containing protein [Succinivibrio sp.]
MNSTDTVLEEGMPCPMCGQPLVVRSSTHGDFLGCSDYPICSFLKPIGVTHTVVDLGPVDAPCPKCGKMLMVKKGRYGIFIGCSDYPECTYVYNPKESLKINCPLCKKGELVQRSSKSGRAFYGCTNYPDCTFSTPGKPVDKICPICSFPVMYEKKFKAGIGLVCANTLCVSRKKRKHLIIRPN